MTGFKNQLKEASSRGDRYRSYAESTLEGRARVE
jgi:hypothetical protein